jgi:UDP-N-acetyl-D-glucosamine dehydrogenase
MGLLNKIDTKKAKIGVIGLGYVGLPLAVNVALSGYNVVGYDIDLNKVSKLRNKENYIPDILDKELSEVVDNGKFVPTPMFYSMKDCDVYIVCVPTPLDEFKNPDLSILFSVSKEIATIIRDDCLVIIESTSYPKTTIDFIKPILDKRGTKYYLAFSPERVDPSNPTYNVKNTPKVVGGINSYSSDLAAKVYSNSLGVPVSIVSKPEVAEFTKILENSYRLVNISLINELARIAERLDVDIWEVIEAAKTKPFGFMPFYPGVGIGGHCIPVDPLYLSHISKKYDLNTTLINRAIEINDEQPYYVVGRILNIMLEHTISKREQMLILGVAYKGDTSDCRESPALKVIKILEEKDFSYDLYDPYVEEIEIAGKRKVSRNIEDVYSDLEAGYYKLAVILTGHTKNIDYTKLQNTKVVFDTKNIMRTLGSSQLLKGEYITL